MVEAIDLDVPAPVITPGAAEAARSRDERALADKLLARMRNQFGGHVMKTPPADQKGNDTA